MPDVLLMPMVHMAEAQFYNEVHWEQKCCDTVLIEGSDTRLAKIVGWGMKIVSRFTNIRLTYQQDWRNHEAKNAKRSRKRNQKPMNWRKNTKTGRLERTVVVGPYFGNSCFVKRTRFVLADPDRKSSNAQLAKVPIWFWILSPFSVIGALFALIFTSRKYLVETLDDETSLSEGLKHGSHLKTIADFVTTFRDDYLAQTLHLEIENATGKNQTIGVSFGAAHMEILHKKLRYEFGYTEAESRSVLAIASNMNHVCSPKDGYGISGEKFNILMGLVSLPKKALPSMRNSNSITVMGLSISPFTFFKRKHPKIRPLDDPSFLTPRQNRFFKPIKSKLKTSWRSLKLQAINPRKKKIELEMPYKISTKAEIHDGNIGWKKRGVI